MEKIVCWRYLAIEVLHLLIVVCMQPALLRRLTNLYPLPRGVLRATRAVQHLQRRSDSARDEWVVIRHGSWHLTVNLTQPHHRAMYYFTRALCRTAERSHLARLIRSMVGPDSIFIDIGANFGLYSMICQAHQPRATVLAVEPEPSTFEAMSRSAQLNGLRNLHAFHLALSDQPGTVELRQHSVNYGGHSIIWRGSQYIATHLVPAETFTAWIKSLDRIDPARISLIKIDVERAECAVIAGMMPFLASSHRPPIYCEIRGSGTAPPGPFDTAHKVIDQLSALGYQAYCPANQLSARSPGRMLSAAQIRGVRDVLFVADNR